MKLITETLFNDNRVQAVISEEANGEKKFRIKGPFIEAVVENKNNRIYPKYIIEREVKKYNEEKIKQGRAMGELNHPECILSKDFDVMTDRGWVSFDKLVAGEEILTININNNTIEKQPIEKIIDEPYTGIGYTIKGRSIDTHTTPTHRFLLKDRYGKYEYVTIENIFNNRTKYRHYSIVKTGNWVGNESATIRLSGIKNKEIKVGKNNGKLPGCFNNNITEDLLLYPEYFLKFLGIWLAEGHIQKPYGICLTQNKKNGDVVDFIDDVLKNLLSECSIKVNKKMDKCGKIIWTFSDKRFYEYLLPLGKAGNKYIPTEIKQLSKMNLEMLLDAFWMGDGTTVKTGTSKDGKIGYVTKKVFTISKTLINDLQECLIKCGDCGNITTVDESGKFGGYSFAGHFIEYKNKKPLYILNCGTTKNIWLDDRFLKIEQTQHNGNVYCLQVKNSNFLMRQNNKVFWTGNSPAINLERVSHKIESLVMEDNMAIGCAILLDTPLGKIAKTLIKEGITLGVSTRGVGSVDDEGNVNEDFCLCAIDLVSDPSAPSCFVEGIMENKEYIISGNQIVEQAIYDLQKKLDKTGSKYIAENMCEFLNALKENL